MREQGKTVLALTITATPSGSFSGNGNGALITSVKRAFDGLALDNTFSETVSFTCTADSYTGNRSAGNESFSVTGEGNQSAFLAFDWPLGSGASGTLSVIDGNSNNTKNNLLTNSGYENWTANIPDNWTLQVGTAGTNINREGGLTYDGTYAMRITGDAGSALTEIRQRFNNTAGTLGALLPLTQYAFNTYARRDGIVPGAGVWRVDLLNADGSVIADEAGVANTFDITLADLTTAYVPYGGVFRTPRVMPSVYYLRQRLSTALTDGRSVYFDKAALGTTGQHYLSGPSYALFAGSVPFQQGDYTSCVVTNSRGAAGTLNTFQTLFARLVPTMMNSGLLVPSSSSPTISDGLIG